MSHASAQYQTSPETRQGLSCWLSCGGRRCPVGILQVGPTGASLALPARDPDALVAPLQQAAQRGLGLVIASERLQTHLYLPVALVQHVSMDGALVLSVAFPPEDRPEGLEGKLRVAFERRGALRVAPDPTAPIAVVLRSLAGRVVGRGVLRDLSATGIGILLAERFGPGVRDHERLNLQFSLPTQEDPLECEAEVRFVRTDTLPGRANRRGTTVLNLGLEFDSEESQKRSFAAPLSRWLTARQIANELGKLPHEVENPWEAEEQAA